MHRHPAGRCALRLLCQKRRAASQLRPTTATMPDVENLHHPPDFVDLIVENVGRVHQPASLAAPGDDRSHARKVLEHLDVIDDGPRHAARGVWIVPSNGFDDLADIVQRFVGEENFEIHSGRSFSTSSSGVNRPASASRMPRSIAASVSSSSFARSSTGRLRSIFTSAMPTR